MTGRIRILRHRCFPANPTAVNNTCFIMSSGSTLKVNPEERLSITELVNQLQEIAAARNVNPKSPITEVRLSILFWARSFGFSASALRSPSHPWKIYPRFGQQNAKLDGLSYLFCTFFPEVIFLKAAASISSLALELDESEGSRGDTQQHLIES